MKRYDILHSHFRLELIELVNEQLAVGWKISGPMVAASYGTGFDYLQPMIKELTELEVIEGRKVLE